MKIAFILILPFCFLNDPSTSQPSMTLTVHRLPPTVRRTMFDPAHLRDDVPSLSPAESAITQYVFSVHVSADPATPQRAVRIDMALQDLIYLPFNATLQLRSHEEGHRELNELLYEQIAEQLAGEVLRDWKSEFREELILRQIQQRFVEKLDQAAARFDQITDHGRGDADVANAVVKVLSEFRR